MIRLAVAASLDHPVGLVAVCVELAIPRSTVYAHRAADGSLPRCKPGPKPLVPDDELLTAIRGVLTDPPFMGEGHRKVHARLRYRGIHADIERVRLLMRDHGLQAPGNPGECSARELTTAPSPPRGPIKCGAPMQPAPC